MKIFLGGTVNESTWRDELIPLLEDRNIQYFNPVVKSWTEECYQEELRQRKICDKVLYTITPRMTGVYSIAEVVDDSNKQPENTILCVLEEDVDDNFNLIEFDNSQLKSLSKVVEMVNNNGGKAKIINSVEEILELL